MSTTPNTELTESIRRQFKRCNEETIQAIIRFRVTGDTVEITPIVLGVIRRYLSTVHQEVLATAKPGLLLSDLHIESLTMLEIILDIQDALDIVVEDAEMRGFVTLGDVYRFLEAKVAQKNSDAGAAEPAQ